MPQTYPHIYTETLTPDLSFEMIFIEGGKFLMGGQDEKAFDNEKPVQEVQVPSFYIGKYPVTQQVWTAIIGENPSRFKGEDRPVESVSWHDAKEFIEKLNTQAGKTYRLPSEAEWEFAARGGIHSEGYLYAGSDKLKEVGWYRENSGRTLQPVGLKMGNELGIYDMSGNVLEWCEDDYHDSYKGVPIDGSAWIDRGSRAASRVLRGSNWDYDSQFGRVSFRLRNEPVPRFDSFGFRLVLSPS